MEKISQQHIKWENTYAVFSAVAESGAISRAEIAARTGLSLMTVGKIADALDACGVVTQEKDERILAGRTARLVAFRSAWHSMVLDLTAKDYCLTVLDLSGKVVEEIRYAYDDTLFCEENLVLFLKNLPLYQRHSTDPAFCIGVGVILPTPYDAEQDRLIGTQIPIHIPLQPRKVLTPLFPDAALHLMTLGQAAARSAGFDHQQYADSLLWLSLYPPIVGALILDGKPVMGANSAGGRFGEITIGTNFTLNEAMLTLTDPTERGVALAIALYTLIATLDPAAISLEIPQDKMTPTFLDALHGRLNQLNAARGASLPTITTEPRSTCSPVFGIFSIIREKWLRMITD